RGEVQAATASATGLACFIFRFLRRPQEARRGFAKVMSEFGEFLGHVDKALSISSARSKALTASMMK
ncbi:hypothetical protein MZD79_17430, partial [Escherichia coli]|nr:hypothetical protein [Escherichia coli]